MKQPFLKSPAFLAVPAFALFLSLPPGPRSSRATIGAEGIRQGRQDVTPLEIVNSDSTRILRRTSEDGEDYRITELYGNVIIRHGDQNVSADRATLNDRLETVRLLGNVHGWDPKWNFWADEVFYRGNERMIIATGNTRAVNLADSTVVVADQFRFDRDTDEGVATGFPRLFQPAGDSTETDTEVVGGENSILRFMREAGWAEISRGAVVNRGEMSISGLWLRSEKDPQRLFVRDEVVLLKDGVRAVGDYMTWDEDSGLARLTGEAPTLNRIAEREEGSLDSVWTTMAGDSLDLHMTDDVLEWILIHGSGEVGTRTMPAPGSTMLGPDSTRVPAEPELMDLVGQDIRITLEEERLDELTATRAAMYYWREDLPERQSAMGGMELQITFLGGEPSVIEARENAVARYFESIERKDDSRLVRAMAALIRLTVEDGEFKAASLENGIASLYSADMVNLGVVSMAVHPDSVRVGASRQQTTQRTRVPPPE